jgi:hypothetical protein
MTTLRLLAVAALWCLAASASSAQIVDTLLTWRTYAQPAHAHLRIFAAPSDARPLTAVIDELASNASGPATDDARFLAETVGRMIGHDPAEMTFVFRFSQASFCGDGAPATKRLLLRATFGRTRAGALASPLWRVITRDELAALTDRALY